ncbi:MAG: sulfurtransferase-like selenium metabolism protein YedF [Suipraeoptans sp.]
MVKVNAIGDVCPTPVIKTKKAIDNITGSETVEVLVDNEIAVSNVSKFGEESGGKVKSEKLGEKEYKITIELGEGNTKKEVVAGTNCTDNTIVVINSNIMGRGNDELGGVLIKGFIYAVSQLDVLPSQMIFYNGGATLTCEGSDSLEDLQYMESKGVEIKTCGTCLDYYKLKEKLQVGQITNMYSIVEAMDNAGKIIMP